MEWEPTGRIRFRKAGWFGRKKLVVQLQESIDIPYDFPLSGAITEYRWRDATHDEEGLRVGKTVELES